MTNKYDGLNETFDTDFSDQQYVDAKLVKKVNEPKIFSDNLKMYLL